MLLSLQMNCALQHEQTLHSPPLLLMTTVMVGGDAGRPALKNLPLPSPWWCLSRKFASIPRLVFICLQHHSGGEALLFYEAAPMINYAAEVRKVKNNTSADSSASGQVGSSVKPLATPSITGITQTQGQGAPAPVPA